MSEEALATAAALAACMADATQDAREALEQALRLLKQPCPRPPGLLRWLVETAAQEGAPAAVAQECALLLGEECWKIEGPEVVAECAALGGPSLAADCAVLCWAAQCGFAADLSMLEAFAALRVCLPLLTTDEDLVGAMRLLVQWLLQVSPRADSAIVLLLHQISDRHLLVSSSRVWSAHNVALLARSLAAHSPLLSPAQRVELIAFPSFLWLPAASWAPLVAAASRLDLAGTAARLLPELLVYCEWDAANRSVIGARMAGAIQRRLGRKVWDALLPCLADDALVALLQPLFQEMGQFDGRAWKQCEERSKATHVLQSDWAALLEASVARALHAGAAAAAEDEAAVVSVIGLCHLRLESGGWDRVAAVRCFDVLGRQQQQQQPHRGPVAMTDAELSEALSILATGNDASSLGQLFSFCRFGYLASCEESSDAPSQRWMVWMGHTLSTQLIARKLRLLPAHPTPQALFSHLARLLASIAAGERPGAARGTQLVLCLVVERLETAMRLAVLAEDKFFVANQRVCEDFFARIRGVLIAALTHVGAFAEATQQWLLRLGEVRDAARADSAKAAELAGSVCAAAALAAEHGLEQATDAIVALGKQECEGLPFLGAMSLIARRKLEEAAAQLRLHLAAMQPASSPEAQFVLTQINLCYLMLGSEGQTHEWLRCAPELPPDAAKRTRLAALQQHSAEFFAQSAPPVAALAEGASAVQMAAWAAERVAAAAPVARQLVSIEASEANLNLCALHVVSRVGQTVLSAATAAASAGASARRVPLWGSLARLNCHPAAAVADFLAGGNVGAAVEASRPPCNPKLLVLQNCVQQGFAVDAASALSVPVCSPEEEGLKATLILRALDKKQLVAAGKVPLPPREELLMRVSDGRVLGLYLAGQLHLLARSCSFDLPLPFREAFSRWLQETRSPAAKQGMTHIAKACLSQAFVSGGETAAAAAAEQLGAVFGASRELVAQLELLLRDLKEVVVDRMARSALAVLTGCLLGSAAADLEVALALVRVLEATGLAQLFGVIVRPAFAHGSWMHVVPQLLARIAHPQFGPLIAEILQTVAAEGGNAQALFWSVRTARDGGGWKAEQREQADVLLQWLTLRHPALCGGCTQLFEGLQSLGALWEERWQRALKALVSALRRNSTGRSVAALQEAVQQLLEETIERGPSSPHELWFARSMSGPLRHLAALLRAGAKHAAEAAEEVLAEVGRMCDSAGSIALADLSPTLAQWSGGDIFIPGSSSRRLLQSLGPRVDVLRTKTRPKRLVAIASDGTTQTLLIKHGEDLRLDERLMQVFRVADQWHYPVVPLGPSCGVIHIVEGLVSLFDLFRKHHQPDDYYAKLQQRLQATKRHQKWLGEVKNARDMEHHRAEWGGEKAVLLDIFRELSRANPSDLLQRELWFNSLTAADWFKRVENFTSSTANVSMLGYVLGLGDRHLDNVLFDPRSGRLLHIDLNVCFESGAQLKVPETVPFRLTQNIRGGMRFGAVEGAFAEACTERLQALRSRAPLIVMLLEAFVLDEIRWDVRKRKHEPGSAIVRRVEQKLAGSDWGRSDMTAREQAEAAIAAAVNEENLAQMYAGWGAWW